MFNDVKQYRPDKIVKRAFETVDCSRPFYIDCFGSVARMSAWGWEMSITIRPIRRIGSFWPVGRSNDHARRGNRRKLASSSSCTEAIFEGYRRRQKNTSGIVPRTWRLRTNGANKGRGRAPNSSENSYLSRSTGRRRHQDDVTFASVPRGRVRVQSEHHATHLARPA